MVRECEAAFIVDEINYRDVKLLALEFLHQSRFEQSVAVSPESAPAVERRRALVHLRALARQAENVPRPDGHGEERRKLETVLPKKIERHLETPRFLH